MPSSPRRSPTLALVSLARVAELELARMLEPHALSLRKFNILTRIAETPGTSKSALARHSGLAAADLEPMLRALQGAGLVRAADERSASVTITPAGSRLLGALEPQLAAIDERLFPEDGAASEASERGAATQEDGGCDRAALAAAVLAATSEPHREPQD